MKVMEGSEAIAEAVRLAHPSVVSAYPITPQTHIVESLAKAIARGELDAEFLTAESEHSAASMALGAAATGVRAFTATSSQGLLYMAEVVFNIAGMRLPVIDSPFALDPENPMTLGTYAEPAVYEEGRYAIEQAQRAARGVLEEAFDDFAEVTGRRYQPWFDAYRLEDAAVALVAMGTAAQTARLAIDHARDEGIPAGLLALRTFRPFPGEQIREALKHVTRVVVLDRSVSLGAGSIVANEFRAALSESAYPADVVGVVAGLGGRDVSVETLERALRAEEDTWIDLKRELVGETS